MPNGHTHTTATLVAAATTPLGLLAFGASLPNAGAYALGCLAGILLTPDHDVDEGNISMFLIRRLFGRVTAWLWQAFWFPYAIIFRHRSFWSHGPVIGTLIRLAYIGIWIVAAIAFFKLPLPSWSPLWIWAFAGLVVSDTLHAAMDWLS